jgi:hypothetical protein
MGSDPAQPGRVVFPRGPVACCEGDAQSTAETVRATDESCVSDGEAVR